MPVILTVGMPPRLLIALYASHSQYNEVRQTLLLYGHIAIRGHLIISKFIFAYLYKSICGEGMGKMLIIIDCELEDRFRRAVAKVYGARRGVISKAVEEAIKLWLEKHEGEK